MNYSKIAIYVVTQIEGALVIAPEGNQIGNDRAVPLAAGPMDVVVEYVARYTAERTAGFDMPTAHTRALGGAHIVSAGHLDPTH
jgi:hypothetical protein